MPKQSLREKQLEAQLEVLLVAKQESDRKVDALTEKIKVLGDALANLRQAEIKHFGNDMLIRAGRAGYELEMVLAAARQLVGQS